MPPANSISISIERTTWRRKLTACITIHWPGRRALRTHICASGRCTTTTRDGVLHIDTASLSLAYTLGSGRFNATNLSIRSKGFSTSFAWRPGQAETGNLKGTARTLDRYRGDVQVGLSGEMLRDGFVELRRGREMDEAVGQVDRRTREAALMLQRGHFGRLGDELAAIENCLKVERSRFEERLDCQLYASAAAREATVPMSLLLPLVENAIKYGLQTSPIYLKIRVGATLRDGAVDTFVENTGHWIEPDPTFKRSTGIGLNNLRRRLALLCGPDARVDISFPDGWVRVGLHLPATPKLP